MTLLPRQSKIFEILMESRDEYISSHQISNYVGVSNKTIQNDLELLNFLLQDFSIGIDSIRGKGYKLNYLPEDELMLLNIMNMLRTQEVKNVDVSLFICRLLIEPLYTTQQEMMDMILCGTSQLKDILSKAVPELSRHKQTVRSVPGSGFIVSGAELGRRLCFAYHLKTIKTNQKTYQRFLDMTKYKGISKESKELLDEVVEDIKKEGYFINVDNEDFLHEYLNYSFNRTHQDTALLSTMHEFPLFRGFSVNSLALNDLLDKNVIEKRYFNIVTQFLINESTYNLRNNDLEATRFEKKALTMVEDFFEKRPNLYRGTFSNIKDLVEEIKVTIILMLRKNAVGFRETRISLTEMSKSDENIVAIEFASLLAFQIENQLKIEFYQEDIIRLGMIFNIYFYKDLWSPYKKIILYSDNSLTAARFLKRALSLQLPYVKIHEANREILPTLKIQDEATLFVVDGYTKTLDYSHVIEVSDFSSSEEIALYVKSYMNSKDEKNMKFFQLFAKERFYPMMSFERRNEVVSWICDKYETSQERKNTIQLNVYTREMRYVSTVYGRAAYPIIYVENLDEPRLELITLMRPMLWGGHEVDVIFMTVLPNSYTSLNILGKPFNDLRVNIRLIQDIKKTTDFDTIIQLLETAIEKEA